MLIGCTPAPTVVSPQLTTDPTPLPLWQFRFAPYDLQNRCDDEREVSRYDTEVPGDSRSVAAAKKKAQEITGADGNGRNNERPAEDVENSPSLRF